MSNLGIKHERKSSLKNRRALGLSYQGKGYVETKLGTSLGVLSHEIGHQIDEKFGFQNGNIMEHVNTRSLQIS